MWKYNETKEYVHESFKQGISLGLTKEQSSERVLVEFDSIVQNSAIEKIMIYVVLIPLCINRSDLIFELTKYLKEINFDKMKGEFDSNDYTIFFQDLSSIVVFKDHIDI